jgi:uncharacterized protein (TIGR03000 family)
MPRRMVTRMKVLALASLGLFLVTGSAKAQQGWPINGHTWDVSYSPDDFNPPLYHAAYPAKRPALVHLRVPGVAKVWFDGFQTQRTGTGRTFKTPPLDEGPEHTYQIRVQWTRDGKDVTHSQEVKVHAGDVINRAVGSPSELAPGR